MGMVAVAQCSGKERQAAVVVCCIFAKRSNLSFIATEGGEQAAPGGETNN
jgi:hypothetical protein